MYEQHLEFTMAYPATGPGVRVGPPTEARSGRGQHLAATIGGGLLFLLIGAAILANAMFSVSTRAQLQAEGRTITAEVVDAQVAQTTRRGSVTSSRYEVKYRFQPPGKAVVASDWQEAPQDVVRTATQTKTIEVRYLPSDPSVNLPDASVGNESGQSGASIWQMTIGAGIALLGLGILFLALKQPRAPRPTPVQSISPNPVR
jgi:hypothetical protein